MKGCQDYETQIKRALAIPQFLRLICLRFMESVIPDERISALISERQKTLYEILCKSRQIQVIEKGTRYCTIQSVNKPQLVLENVFLPRVDGLLREYQGTVVSVCRNREKKITTYEIVYPMREGRIVNLEEEERNQSWLCTIL